MPYTGEAAGLATAVLWAFTSLCFSEAAFRVGPFHVNKLRLLFAACIYAFIFTLRTGVPWPKEMATDTILWLCLSSLIGIVIGDSLLFAALMRIGARLTTLIYASVPVMVTLAAWIFLKEKLGVWDLVGIAITLSGIIWVVSERRDHGTMTQGEKDHHSRKFRHGILFGLGGALGQAAGLVTSKQALVHTGVGVSPLSAAFVRILFGAAVMLSISMLRGQIPGTLQAMKNRSAMLFTMAGTIVGPFLGIWMSLVAVSLIAAGVAATLNSMVPILVIPLVMIFKKEKVSVRAILGSVIAVGGVAILCLN